MDCKKKLTFGDIMSISKEAVLDGLRKAVIEGDADSCKVLAERAIKVKIDAYRALMSCIDGMTVVGEKFNKKEYFVPELLLSADATYAAMDILIPNLNVEKSPESELGKVVIGVVEGDIHDIGKNLLKALLEISSFKVFDLGKNVPLRMFTNKTKETNANIIALSTLMSTTLPGIKIVIDNLKDEGIRDKVKVIIGGASTSKIFAEKIGADAWAENAFEGFKEIRRILGKEGKKLEFISSGQ